jgi:hypothetical protein
MKFRDYINLKYFIESNNVVSGIEVFLKNLITAYPSLENHIDIIKKFIEKSGCKKISIRPFKIGALGMSLSNGVVLNPTSVYAKSIEHTLYVLFHEIAHQYQYKKQNKW